MYNVSSGVQRFAESGDTSQGGLELARELGRQGGQVFDVALPRPRSVNFLTGRTTKSTRVFVDADHSFVSVLSKQVTLCANKSVHVPTLSNPLVITAMTWLYTMVLRKSP